MRIIGGQAQRQRLKGGRGRATRPTPAAVRKVLFDILAPRLEGATFADLFAGYGAVGLEALSRGAAVAVFVERSRTCCRLIEENLQTVGLRERGEVRCETVERTLSRWAIQGVSFDLIFMDPPYQTAATAACLGWLGEHPDLLTGSGLVIVQHHCKEPLAASYGPFLRHRERRVGDTQLSFYGREEPGEGVVE